MPCLWLQMPQSGDLWGCYVDLETRRMDSWERAIPLFRYNKETPFFEVRVVWPVGRECERLWCR